METCKICKQVFPAIADLIEHLHRMAIYSPIRVAAYLAEFARS